MIEVIRQVNELDKRVKTQTAALEKQASAIAKALKPLGQFVCEVSVQTNCDFESRQFDDGKIPQPRLEGVIVLRVSRRSEQPKLPKAIAKKWGGFAEWMMTRLNALSHSGEQPLELWRCRDLLTLSAVDVGQIAAKISEKLRKPTLVQQLYLMRDGRSAPSALDSTWGQLGNFGGKYDA